MIEYPVLIARVENSLVVSHAETGSPNIFGWDLHYVAQGSYQLRIMNNNEVVNNRNITLKMIFQENDLTTTQGTFYTSIIEGYLQIADILPSPEDLKMILRVFVYSNPYYNDGRDLDFCEETECLAPIPLHEGSDHTECESCERLQAPMLMEAYYVISNAGEDILYICNTCGYGGYTITDIDGIAQCGSCGDFHHDTNLQWVNILQTGEAYSCQSCIEDLYSCVECGILGHIDNFVTDEYDDETYCSDCSPDNNNELVRNWNYLPDLIFHPAIPLNPLKPLYIGIEIEIQWENWKYEERAANWLENIRDNHEDIMFVKSDSSVNDGFELVTHPMSPEWAMENFPFEMLKAAVDNGAAEKHPSTGIHIHIDRGALSTAQLWKILKVHEKQRELCGLIGGRGTTNTYASWDNNYDCVGEQAMEIARLKGEAWGGADRYVPINLKNENTIELRYLEGSIAVPDLKKNIQWVQALYDFTDHISVEDVKKGVLDIPGFLLGWIVDQEKIYPQLTTHLLARCMIPLEMPERKTACV